MFRFQPRTASAQDLEAANVGRSGVSVFEPYEDTLRAIENAQMLSKVRRRAYLEHPDERVFLKVAGRDDLMGWSARHSFSLAAVMYFEEQAEDEGLLWTPGLDAASAWQGSSLHRDNRLLPRIKRVGEWVAAQQEPEAWLALLRAFRCPLLLQEVGRQAPLSDEHPDAFREATRCLPFLAGLGENPNVTARQMDELVPVMLDEIRRIPDYNVNQPLSRVHKKYGGAPDFENVGNLRAALSIAKTLARAPDAIQDHAIQALSDRFHAPTRDVPHASPKHVQWAVLDAFRTIGFERVTLPRILDHAIQSQDTAGHLVNEIIQYGARTRDFASLRRYFPEATLYARMQIITRVARLDPELCEMVLGSGEFHLLLTLAKTFRGHDTAREATYLDHVFENLRGKVEDNGHLSSEGLSNVNSLLREYSAVPIALRILELAPQDADLARAVLRDLGNKIEVHRAVVAGCSSPTVRQAVAEDPGARVDPEIRAVLLKSSFAPVVKLLLSDAVSEEVPALLQTLVSRDPKAVLEFIEDAPPEALRYADRMLLTALLTDESQERRTRAILALTKFPDAPEALPGQATSVQPEMEPEQPAPAQAPATGRVMQQDLFAFATGPAR